MGEMNLFEFVSIMKLKKEEGSTVVFRFNETTTQENINDLASKLRNINLPFSWIIVPNHIDIIQIKTDTK